ncbi:MAG: hypothetical protein GVY13_07240 [Alphaproteobacteria bacterium]|nr:hypothetical protein [Alphaproteobacteria bacterium]
MTRTRQNSTLVSHNVTIGGRRTSIRLEEYMWEALKEICARENINIHEFCSRVDEHRKESALTAAIRVAITAYYREGMKQLSRGIEAGGQTREDRSPVRGRDDEDPPRGSEAGTAPQGLG